MTLYTVKLEWHLYIVFKTILAANDVRLLYGWIDYITLKQC